MTTENESLTAQWTAAQEQVAQAEARLASFKAHREALEGELYRLLGKEGFRAFYMRSCMAHLRGQLRAWRPKPPSRAARKGELWGT